MRPTSRVRSSSRSSWKSWSRPKKRLPCLPTRKCRTSWNCNCKCRKRKRLRPKSISMKRKFNNSKTWIKWVKRPFKSNQEWSSNSKVTSSCRAKSMKSLKNKMKISKKVKRLLKISLNKSYQPIKSSRLRTSLQWRSVIYCT